MSNSPYVIAAYVIALGSLLGYWLSIRWRLGQARRGRRHQPPTNRSHSPSGE